MVSLQEHEQHIWGDSHSQKAFARRACVADESERFCVFSLRPYTYRGCNDATTCTGYVKKKEFQEQGRTLPCELLLQPPEHCNESLTHQDSGKGNMFAQPLVYQKDQKVSK